MTPVGPTLVAGLISYGQVTSDGGKAGPERRAVQAGDDHVPGHRRRAPARWTWAR